METLNANPVVSNSQIIVDIAKGQLTLNEVKGLYANEYQKAGTMTVELRQEITTNSKYPSQKATHNLQDSLFSTEEFGFETKDFSSKETRMAWINVPATATIEDVKAKLAAAPQAMIYKILSNRPILSEDQEYALANGIGTQTIDDYANKQVIRYSADHENTALRGKIILDPNGKVQYRKTFFSQKNCQDVMDVRTADLSDFYSSPEIVAELSATGSPATVVSGQALN